MLFDLHANQFKHFEEGVAGDATLRKKKPGRLCLRRRKTKDVPAVRGRGLFGAFYSVSSSSSSSTASSSRPAASRSLEASSTIARAAASSKLYGPESLSVSCDSWKLLSSFASRRSLAPNGGISEAKKRVRPRSAASYSRSSRSMGCLF